MKTQRVFWALNRNNNTVTALKGFICFEQVQGAFRCGIQMPDGKPANGIGRSKSMEDLKARALRSGYTVI